MVQLTQVLASCTKTAAALLLFAAASSGCQAYFADTLDVRERVPLADSSLVHLEIDPLDRIWIAGDGWLVRLDSTAAPPVRVQLATGEAPEWLEAYSDRLIVAFQRQLVSIDSSTLGEGEISTELVLHEVDDAPMALAADPVGRFIYRTAPAGSLIAHDPATLVPVWGWAAVGAEATGIGLSPGGEYLYQALDLGGGEAEVLVRDVQTGRIIRRTELPHALAELIGSPQGSVYGVGWQANERQGGVIELRWSAGQLQLGWRRSLRELDIDPPIRAALSRSGRLLAVLGAGNETGLHILDVETGATIHRWRGRALDVAFDTSDQLYVLVPGELLRLE